MRQFPGTAEFIKTLDKNISLEKGDLEKIDKIFSEYTNNFQKDIIDILIESDISNEFKEGLLQDRLRKSLNSLSKK